MIKSINPATEETLTSFEEMTGAQIEEALDRAASLARDFGQRANLSNRLTALSKLAGVLRARADEIAAVITAEMGKPITQARAEVEKSASCCDYYVEHAEGFLQDEIIATSYKSSYVRWLPIGPVLAVMPWNFPLWQVIRFAAPALAAGNICLLKHASNVPQMALLIEELCLEAGFPKGAFQTLLIGSSKVEAVIRDKRVRAVTLTGSEPAGRAVAERAGAELKKSVLELGGSDPFIVMPSADLDRAVETAVTARTQNSGQSCISAKRFIVHADIYDAFLEKLVERFSSLKTGDPKADDTKIGPLATADIRDELKDQVDKSVSAGAKIAYQTQLNFENGYWYPPTILTDIPADAPAADEELFGPVASVYSVSSIEDAITLANATRFGLGSAAWTTDEREQARFVDELDAGFTAINGMTSSDPKLPFGGVKDSGFGRELSELGFREFLNAKTVTVSN